MSPVTSSGQTSRGNEFSVINGATAKRLNVEVMICRYDPSAVANRSVWLDARAKLPTLPMPSWMNWATTDWRMLVL